jgi:hypothetical protein
MIFMRLLFRACRAEAAANESAFALPKGSGETAIANTACRAKAGGEDDLHADKKRNH